MLGAPSCACVFSFNRSRKGRFMFKFNRTVGLMATTILFTGCAMQPVTTTSPSVRVAPANAAASPNASCTSSIVPVVTSTVQGCATCTSGADCSGCRTVQPVYAYAVTRPAQCNDFPVTYRVQIPDTDSRVRNVDFYMR